VERGVALRLLTPADVGRRAAGQGVAMA